MTPESWRERELLDEIATLRELLEDALQTELGLRKALEEADLEIARLWWDE